MCDAESVIEAVIRKISRECAERGRAVSNTVVAFTVRAAVLDPRNGLNVDRTQDIQKLGQLCVDKLMEECSPSLDTVRMQQHFDLNYTSRREFLEEMQRVVESNLRPVSRDITDSRAQTKKELDALYHKIVSYVLLRSSMGSPTDASAVQEAAAALQSVFPKAGLGAFMVLLKRDKEQQLNELTMIVTGIRLLNKAIETGGEENDLHEFIHLPVTTKSIENELRASRSLAWKYTAVLEKLTDPDVPIDLLKQALYNIRQHEVFLKILLADACVCAERAEGLQADLSSRMKQLKETVKAKTAVPTAQVFPLFKALSKLWCDLQDEAELLNILRNIMLGLQPYVASQAKIFPESRLDSLLEASEVKADEQRMTESSGERIVPAEMKMQEWLLPETTDSFNELPLQYNGFCGYTLVTRDGLLLPGNPHVGVLKHKEKLYVFSSKKAAVEFSSSCDDFIAEVAEKAKLSPELIHLLRLRQQFSCFSASSEMQIRGSLEPTTRCDSGTQTDIHPLETNIVKSYEWNEWELRRKTIKLADLWTKVTHSTQTDLSHMRRENVTQTWLPKSAACQSTRDDESNVPKPQTYLTGLRGQRRTEVVKTNLTRSIDE